MVSLKDNGDLTQAPKRYSRRLASARSVMDWPFSLLKNLFFFAPVDGHPLHVFALFHSYGQCVLLHLCLLHEESAEDFLGPIDKHDDEHPDDEDLPDVSAVEKWQTLVAQFAGSASLGCTLSLSLTHTHIDTHPHPLPPPPPHTHMKIPLKNF